MQQKIVENVEKLYEKYSGKIKTNKHLLLLYWKEYDCLQFNGKYISTQDYLKSTSEEDIINAKLLLQIIKQEENENASKHN